MSGTYQLGRQAEELASKYLVAKGYTVLKTNWRWGKKEIDIICTCRDWLIIVEVKSRFSSIHPVAGEVVGIQKQRNLITAAEGFIMRYNINLPTRFDIISVVFSGYDFDIEHIENAFIPEPW